MHRGAVRIHERIAGWIWHTTRDVASRDGISESSLPVACVDRSSLGRSMTKRFGWRPLVECGGGWDEGLEGMLVVAEQEWFKVIKKS